jgi:hypothetical protein
MTRNRTAPHRHGGTAMQTERLILFTEKCRREFLIVNDTPTTEEQYEQAS